MGDDDLMDWVIVVGIGVVVGMVLQWFCGCGDECFFLSLLKWVFLCQLWVLHF